MWLGSPLAKSKANGQAAERHGFDAWGAGREGNGTPRPEGRLGSTLSPRGFTGHEHLDVVGGLIHMNGRAYDPNLGRFLSVDPIIQFPANSQSLNPYSYLMNNPLSGIDPTGYVGCGDVNIKGGTSGTCTHALAEGGEVEVGYNLTEKGMTISGTTQTHDAILADNGARLAQASVGADRAAGSTVGAPSHSAVGQFTAPVQTAEASGSIPASSSDEQTDAGGPLGADRAYDPSGRGYHRYEMYNDLCAVSQKGCTAEGVGFEAARRFPAPGWDPKNLVQNFDETTIQRPWWSPISPGTVYHLVDSESLSIYNITKDNHFLRYGEVKRGPVVRNDMLQMRTGGEGNNISAWRTIVNMRVYQAGFNDLDAQAREWVQTRLREQQ